MILQLLQTYKRNKYNTWNYINSPLTIPLIQTRSTLILGVHNNIVYSEHICDLQRSRLTYFTNNSACTTLAFIFTQIMEALLKAMTTAWPNRTGITGIMYTHFVGTGECHLKCCFFSKLDTIPVILFAE